MQVAEAIHSTAAASAPACCRSTAGSRSAGSCAALERGVDVVVATPGRALDHLDRGTLRLGAVADRRPRRGRRDARHGLRRGHRGDPRRDARGRGRPCCSRPPCRRASRASPGGTCSDPVRIKIGARAGRRRARRRGCARAPTSSPGRTSSPRSAACSTSRRRPPRIVFCRTRDEVDELTETLNGRGYRAEALHGGMSQEQRDRVMGRLRGETADLLVATDVAARGLDIEHLTHVINYDVPCAPESYVHRIGRVGRAGREGVAITLAEPREHRMLKTIEQVTGQRIAIEKVPTVADLRARRLELTRAALRESLLEPTSLDRVPRRRRDAGRRVRRHGGRPGRGEAGPRGRRADGRRRGRDPGGRAPAPAPASARGATAARGEAPAAAARPAAAAMTRLYVGAGRNAGIRPQDLVGAITGESAPHRPRGRRHRDRRPLLPRRGAAGQGRGGHPGAARRDQAGKKPTVRRERYAGKPS